MNWIRLDKLPKDKVLNVPLPSEWRYWENKEEESSLDIANKRIYLDHIGLGIWLKYLPETNTMYWWEE